LSLPNTAIVSGELAALLVKINFPESAPTAVGINLIESVIAAPGARTNAERCDEKTALVLVSAVMRSVSPPVLDIRIVVHKVESTGVVPTSTLREAVVKIGILIDDNESGFVAPVPFAVTAPVLANDLPITVEVDVIVIEMCASIFP